MKHLIHTLQDSFEYEGTWWLSDIPEDELPGKLTFDQERGVRLSLMGALGPLPPFSSERFRCDIINGMTENGIACTLVKNTEINRTLNSPGGEKQIFISNTLFLGEILTTLEQLQFSNCSFSLEHLEEWMKPRPFEYTRIKEEGNLVGVQVKVISRTAFEEQIEAIDAIFSLTNRYSSSDSSSTETTLGNEAFLKVQPTVSFDLETYRNWVTDIARLVAVAMGENSWPRKFQLTIAESESVESDSNNTPKRFPVSTFFRTTLGKNKHDLHRFEMLLDFDTFVERLPHIADSWIGAGHRLQPVKDLFFMAMYSEGTYLEYRFLSLVHALESYHRSIFGSILVDQDKERRYYLRERLEQLLCDLDEELGTLITDSPESFIAKIIATRNYYVHFEEELKTKAMDHDDMFYTYQRLGLFVRIILLREIGFGDKEVFDLLKDKKRLLPWDREE